jgi:hypothetical protein
MAHIAHQPGPVCIEGGVSRWLAGVVVWGCGPAPAPIRGAWGASSIRVVMAGPASNPVQGFRTSRDLHWEFLRLWTGFELPSSCTEVPCYALNLNQNILDFMRWPRIDLGAQDLNAINGQNMFSKNS